MAMKFFKGKEDTRVKAIRAVRAKYVDPETNEIEVQFVNEDKQRLTLILTPAQGKALCEEIAVAYQAINPPLNVRSNYAPQWMGMED